jgi:hypothetical protein
MAAWTLDRYPDGVAHPGVELDPAIHRMIERSITESSPAWRRINRLTRERYAQRTG